MDTTKPARRAFLAGLSVAVAAPAVVARVAAANTPSAPAEVPEILAIGERLPALVEAARAASQRKAEARAMYERTKPPVPEPLVVGSGEYPWRDTTEDEVDIDGKVTPYLGRMPTRRIYRARNLKAFLIRYDLWPDDAKRARKPRADRSEAREGGSRGAGAVWLCGPEGRAAARQRGDRGAARSSERARAGDLGWHRRLCPGHLGLPRRIRLLPFRRARRGGRERAVTDRRRAAGRRRREGGGVAAR